MMKMSRVAAIATMAAVLGAPVAFGQSTGLQEQWVTAPESTNKPTWDEYYVYWLDAGYGATTLQWTAAEQENMLMWDDAENFAPVRAAGRQLSAAEREEMRVFELNDAYSVDGALGAGSADWAEINSGRKEALVWDHDYVYWLDAAPGGALLWRAGAVWDGYYVSGTSLIAQSNARIWDEEYAYFLDTLPTTVAAQAEQAWNLDSTYGFDTAAHEEVQVSSRIWDEDMAFLPAASQPVAGDAHDRGNLIRTSVQH
jgi:hypothetical protein